MSTKQNHESPYDRFQFGMPDRLAKSMEVAGVTNGDMADYLGLSETTIGNYTSGRTAPKKQTLRLWAMRTGAPLQWLEIGVFPEVGPAGLEPTTPAVDDRWLAPVTPIFGRAA